jgi:hypothetical protein
MTGTSPITDPDNSRNGRLQGSYLGRRVPPDTENALERWQRMQPKPEPKPRERKLDTAPPTLDEVDRRIEERVAAEHEFMIDILAEVLAQLNPSYSRQLGNCATDVAESRYSIHVSGCNTDSRTD